MATASDLNVSVTTLKIRRCTVTVSCASFRLHIAATAGRTHALALNSPSCLAISLAPIGNKPLPHEVNVDVFSGKVLTACDAGLVLAFHIGSELRSQLVA